MKTELKFNSLLYGLILGIFLPPVALVIFWAIRFEWSFFEFLSQYYRMGLLSKVISLCIIPNLLLFFIFIWTNRTFSARGVVLATIVMAFVMLVIKFT